MTEKRKPERRNRAAAPRTGVAVGCEVSCVGRSTVYNRTLGKTAVDFNAESQRCRVMQRKSEVLRGNGKYKNFSDRVNLHQLG